MVGRHRSTNLACTSLAFGKKKRSGGRRPPIARTSGKCSCERSTAATTEPPRSTNVTTTLVAPGSTRLEVIRAYRRGDAFGAASVLDGSRRAMTVTAVDAAGGAPGWARVAFAVITRDTLDQLGFLRDALARAEGCE